MKTMNHSEYPKTLKTKSIDSLRFIQRDAHEAVVANPNGENAGYYQDEVNYIGDELRRRQNAGL